jgi:hypothetical protein
MRTQFTLQGIDKVHHTMISYIRYTLRYQGIQGNTVSDFIDRFVLLDIVLFM